MDTGTLESLDALQLQSSAVCLKVHKYPDDLQILNEVACFTVIYDFLEPGNPKKLWANAAWLDYVGQTLEEFRAYDFAGNTSAHIKKQMLELGRDIQINRKLVSFDHTAYPVDTRPLRVLLVQRPILFEGMEHPLILVSYFNGDNSLADQTLKAEPLDFTRQREGSEEALRVPESLAVLDEAPCFALLCDFAEHGSPRAVWANQTWLQFSGQSLADAQGSVDPACLGLSREQKFAIGGEVQRLGRTLSFQATVYVRPKPLRVLAVWRPVAVAGGRLALCTLVPPGAHCGAGQQLEQVLFKEQVLALLDQAAVIFHVPPGPGPAPLPALWCNFAARAEYGLTYDIGSLATPEGVGLQVAHVLESCEWSTAQPPGLSREQLLRRLSRLRLGSAPLCFTCRKRRPDPVWHQLIFVRCKNPYTGADTLLLQESDVSALMEAQGRLEASNQLKDRFLQCVSHELRTPLNGILGLSASICAAADTPPRFRRILAAIDDSATRLNTLVSDILEASTCMNGNFQLECIPVNLAEICERVCETLRPRLQSGVRLENRIVHVGIVEADASRITKCFAHLIENAVKFTQHGSIIVTADVIGSDVQVSVADTGCGIRGEILDRVWNCFEQGDMSATREHGGIGLGLAMVRSVIRAHGGDVYVRSESGTACAGGSTFTFVLPLRQANHAEFSSVGSRRASDSMKNFGSVATTAHKSRSDQQQPEADSLERGIGDVLGREILEEQLRELQAKLAKKEAYAEELEGKVYGLEQQVQLLMQERAKLVSSNEEASAGKRRLERQLELMEKMTRKSEESQTLVDELQSLVEQLVLEKKQAEESTGYLATEHKKLRNALITERTENEEQRARLVEYLTRQPLRRPSFLSSTPSVPAADDTAHANAYPSLFRAARCVTSTKHAPAAEYPSFCQPRYRTDAR